ncbi:mitochondrial carrier domain-containing protein, putative [Eimeria tenella]|uniref:Mitochondrial carrier domain-containing protein, putative n=1 Tax=Eimeria tenella TaxID=5802 RepID=U6KXX3_EIMTE|nr:mitochondrial carrier domain-containing protein, putative [Eimeria tenella]CDJ42821.1 mitochondrial carrier domain-containing protein, putative [Eimeria tenella]|eukprot:XP_013233571.1 mitochondrial carrier domain-containing protein, putative [Eimeria tenella]
MSCAIYRDRHYRNGKATQPSYECRFPQASGLVAGVLVTCLTHPLWLAKARMEMQAKEAEVAGWPLFHSGFSCIVSVARGGVRESYKGIGPALALAPHAAIQIAVYERLKRNHASQGSCSTSTGLPALWGAASKFAALSVTYPLQVLRSRQQVYSTPYANLNFLQIAIRMVREEGVLSLFGGYWVHTQRACLQSGIMFLIYEGILNEAK